MRRLKLTIFATFLALIFAGPLCAQQAAENLETQTVVIKGIGCQGDLPIIKKNVEALEGVSEWKALDEPGPKTEFQVIFDPAITNRAAIVEAVEDSPCCDHPDRKPYKVKKSSKKK